MFGVEDGGTEMTGSRVKLTEELLGRLELLLLGECYLLQLPHLVTLHTQRVLHQKHLPLLRYVLRQGLLLYAHLFGHCQCVVPLFPTHATLLNNTHPLFFLLIWLFSSFPPLVKLQNKMLKSCSYDLQLLEKILTSKLYDCDFTLFHFPPASHKHHFYGVTVGFKR